ncbi:Mak10 subunit, NatC N-terminal acetyltransferase-domain-containing protein [Earliella scabrosa]|nr:Mak10 subunit, NatC N-terminal acetyltransferase-domain-containing protein [Earliella scabrosa]
MVGYDASYDDWFDAPGGDDFEDVTELLVAGAQDMEPEEVILMDGFTLMDAMSAFEIGEPRLDSGMVLEEQRRPPFDPLTPLLPEEVCWLLDRSFACEVTLQMEWHAGKTLSQSVFTILFVHHLPDINPEYLAPEEDADPARPRWLVTVVVRAGVLGMLKCCDLAWRELSKNRVHDIEDWQGEKCDVSLLEGINAEIIVNMLDAACEWVRQANLSENYTEAICQRLMLRKSLIELYRLNLLRESTELGFHIALARGLLQNVRTMQTPLIPPDSPIHLAIDPYIARRLPNFMPIRVTELPPLTETWDTLDGFLQYWRDVGHLVNSQSILKWEVAGSVRNALYMKPPASFHRSLAQSLFFDQGVILGTHKQIWLVEQFFYETMGLSYATILQYFDQSAPAMQQAAMRDVIKRRISKLMVPHVRSNWYNPPRRRRHLMKEVLQWHMLYDVMLKDVAQHKPPDSETAAVLAAVPRTAQLWRLTACREVILSGFQQELYAPEEKPIAYWYLARVLDYHIGCIEDVLPVVPAETSAFHELRFQASHLSALQMMCTALVALTAGHITSSWRRISLNFLRRFKWLFDPEFDKLVPADPVPDLFGFPPALEELSKDELYSPSASFELARDIFVHLSQPQEWIGHWSADRRRYLRNLADVCDDLSRVAPSSMLELPNFDLRTLQWIPDAHPWFPTTVSL